MAIDLTQDIVSWWRLNDSSGTLVRDDEAIHSGSTTVDISTITSSDAPDGRLRSFNIANDINKIVTIDSSSDFTFASGGADLPFSLSVWIKDPSAGGWLLSKDDLGSNREYNFFIGESSLQFSVYNNAGEGRGKSWSLFSNSIDDGLWHHIVFTYSASFSRNQPGTGMRSYLDGVEKTFGALTGSGLTSEYISMTDTDANVIIGAIGANAWDSRLSDAMIFNKQLTDGEVKFLYNDGFGVNSLTSDEFISAPTLTFPNGGEVFTEGSIDIQWQEPGDFPITDLTWYEIFITDDYDIKKKPELIQIATIPNGNSSYSYTIQKNLRGKKSRVGIRSVNHRGSRSKISFSADSFTIINEFLPSPSLIEPVSGNTYFSYILFAFDHVGVMGRASQRAFYQVYYKSDNQNIDWTLLKSNIMVGSDPINIDVSDFATNSDYFFKVEMVDGDSVSAPVFIEDININNINLFLIDTTPPRGSIKIIDNQEFIKDNVLLLTIDASDASTTTKDVQIQQLNVLTDEVATGSFVPLTPILTWDIRPEGEGIEIVDGVKLIQARFRDHGENVITASSEKFFRTYKNVENKEVSVIIYGPDNNLYYAFKSQSGSNAELYKNLTFVSTLEGNSTALEFYNNVLYIAVEDDENKGILQRLTTGIETVADNDQQFFDSGETQVNSLYSADSVINAMEVFDGGLFLGLDNGELLSFRGSSVSSIHSDYKGMRSINYIRTDGILLYIFFSNTAEMLIMRKNSNGNYVFNTVDSEN